VATATQNPISDEAVSGTWTESAGSRYTFVDDYPDASGTDKLVHGTTAGNITFGFNAFSIPAGASSISVSVLYYDDKNGTQACNVGARLKVGGNYYNAATHNPQNGVFNQRTDTWATNPKTAAAWTVDDINGVGANALQAFGWVSTDASPTIDLTSIQLQVIYTNIVSLAGVSAGVATVTGALTVTGGGAVVSLAGISAGVATVTGTLDILRDRVNTILANVQTSCAANQPGYFTTWGRYFQGIAWSTNIPADGATVEPDKLVAPTDYPHNWNVPPITSPALAECRVAIHVYNGLQGQGYEIVGEYISSGVTYRRVINVGPETWREQAWSP